MSRDKQQFETHHLENGITVFHYPETCGFAYCGIRLPVGHMHNVGDFPPGSAHFLEHVVCDRSEMFPEWKGFKHWTGLNGGHFGASTNQRFTTYETYMITERFDETFAGLWSQVYQPLLLTVDIDKERTIIRNERQSKRWFPGSDEITHYLGTGWMHSMAVSLEMVFGDDDSLDRMISLTSLRELHHRTYWSNQTVVMVVGELPEGGLERILARFSNLETKAVQLKSDYRATTWANHEYHERTFQDTNRYRLYFGDFSEKYRNDGEYHGSVPEAFACYQVLGFYLRYLINPITGPLYRWLRDQNAWVYGLEHNLRYDGRTTKFHLSFPMQTPEQVQVVRDQISERLHEALADEELIRQNIQRTLLGRPYQLQTMHSIWQAAWQSLFSFGRIVSQAEQDTNTGFAVDLRASTLRDHLEPALCHGFCAKPLG